MKKACKFIALGAVTIALLASCSLFGMKGMSIEAENVPYEWYVDTGNSGASTAAALQRTFENTVRGKQFSISVTEPDGSLGSISILFDQDGTLGIASMGLVTDPSTTIIRCIGSYMDDHYQKIGSVTIHSVNIYGSYDEATGHFVPTDVEMWVY